MSTYVSISLHTQYKRVRANVREPWRMSCYNGPSPLLFVIPHPFFFSLPTLLPLLCSPLLSSPLFDSPLFSSPILSLPPPSVYPIWLSHLSWELSQGAKLLIQFLLNIMTLRSVFTIHATCRAKEKN